jgi:hypothetical protein
MSGQAPLCIRIQFVAVVLLFLGGCFGAQRSDVPRAGNRSAEIVVVRERNHTGSLISHYLSLDGVTIARLDNGEYTSFTVSEGVHTLGVQWTIPVLFSGGPFILNKQFEAQAGGTYLFVSRGQQAPEKTPPGPAPDYSRAATFSQLDWSQHDLMVKDKTYVAPGR